MLRSKKRTAGAPQEMVKKPEQSKGRALPSKTSIVKKDTAYSFDFVLRSWLEDELMEDPIICDPRSQDVDAWTKAMVNRENVAILLQRYQELMRIPNDCTIPSLHRWLQKWSSKLKAKDKWILEVNAAMRNPDQVPHGKASRYLRKAAVHQEVFSQDVCEKLIKLLPKVESSTKRGTTQFDTKYTKSYELAEEKVSHKEVFKLLKNVGFESKMKQLVLKATPGLQRSNSGLREITEEDVQMQVFVNIYEPGPQESANRGGKKRKREKVDKNEGKSGIETHTDSSGAAAVVLSLTGDGDKPGLYWVRDKETGKDEQRKLEQFQLPLCAGDAALIHRGCIHGVHFAVRSTRRITLNIFFKLK